MTVAPGSDDFDQIFGPKRKGSVANSFGKHETRSSPVPAATPRRVAKQHRMLCLRGEGKAVRGQSLETCPQDMLAFDFLFGDDRVHALDVPGPDLLHSQGPQAIRIHKAIFPESIAVPANSSTGSTKAAAGPLISKLIESSCRTPIRRANVGPL